MARERGMRVHAGLVASATAVALAVSGLSGLSGCASVTAATGSSAASTTAAASAEATVTASPSNGSPTTPAMASSAPSAGTSGVSPATTPVASGRASASRAPAAVSPARLAERIAKAAGGDVDDLSVTVHDRRTGQITRVNSGLRNCTGSIVKVLILVALIHRERAEGRGLSAAQRAEATRMITVSDNDASESLFRQAGRAEGVQQVADDLGMTRTVVSPAWGATTTSAADQALLIDALVAGTPDLTSRDRAFVLDLMSRVVDEQRWGVGSVPDDVMSQVKNGWVELEPLGWRINSIGHVVGEGRDYTIAMLSYGNDTMGQGVARLDAVSRVVFASTAS